MSRFIIILTSLLLVFGLVQPVLAQSSEFTPAQKEEFYRSNGITFYDAADLSQSCVSNTVSPTASALPGHIPEPLRTIFAAAAQEHGTDPVMVAVIYATENALYHNNRHLTDQWLLDKVHANAWATSGGGAKGPFQFIDGTWGENMQEGPFLYDSSTSKWTTNKGDSDGINVAHIDDAAFGAAQYLSTVGATNGVALGSVDQEFLRNN